MTPIKTVHFISSLERGGRERQLCTIYANNKEIQNIKILYFRDADNSYIDEFDIKRDDTHKIKGKKIFTQLWYLYKYLREEKPSVLYAWGAMEFFLSFLLSPFFSFKLINGSIRHGIVLPKFSHKWRTFLLHLSSHVVANSKAGLNANKLERGSVLYNGIDPKFFLRNGISAEIKGKCETLIKPIFISVANLVPYKDYPTIFKALSNISRKGYEFSYLIIGKGPLLESFREQVNSLGLQNRVTFLGAISNVEEYLQLSDIFIHSSKGEGCSNAILEAMASGLPIIASDTGGTSEIISEKNGFLFEYRNVEQLEERLLILLNNREKVSEMGENSLLIAKTQFSVQNMMTNYYRIVETIANS